jgi:hypothetical protein
MSRVARVSEYLGSDGGGFYLEEPDIPEGLTCQEWRVKRSELRAAERTVQIERTVRSKVRRPSLAWPVLRARLA